MRTAIRWLGEWSRRRSLRNTMVAMLTLTGIGGAVAVATFLALVISPSFDRLEQQAIMGYRQRAQTLLADITQRVEEIARDHAGIVPDVFPNHPIQGVAYRTAADGRWKARWRDPGHPDEAAAMASALADALNRRDLSQLLEGRDSNSFYLPLRGRIAAIGIATVTGVVGRPRDYLAVARVLTPAHLSRAMHKTARLTGPASGTDRTMSKETRGMEIAVPVAGLDGRAVGMARFRISREVTLLGRRVLLLATAGSILLLVFTLLMLRRALGWLVLAPLGRVECHMQRVQASGVLSPYHDREGRDDEFGSLGRSFNAMLSQLKDLREQNEIQSFALGRSESAVAVLHNVRNALSPLGAILSHGGDRSPAYDRALIDRALAELAGEGVPPERRVKLVAFVAGALDAEAKAREAVRARIDIGRDAMRQTLEIIGAQQARAHERPPRERCDVTDIIARNATIARYSQAASIHFAFPARPFPVLANRVILSQVVGNLFANAIEAIAETGRDHGAITVTIQSEGGRVTVRIMDDGQGFDPALATKLFRSGFSTRTEKSGGLGLHWCANSTAAMGGSLELHSHGQGLGAVAILVLEAAEETEADADRAV
ncbi:ATP-binding protein [Sphingomonas sp. NCPPB 2930]|uniref:ATP-binding protein n=1 Tax=Sphingomonas sp. NCPPB 2930 TaxID=3162788 RepID=UPI0036DE37F4